jgi:hypothetical protein
VEPEVTHAQSRSQTTIAAILVLLSKRRNLVIPTLALPSVPLNAAETLIAVTARGAQTTFASQSVHAIALNHTLAKWKVVLVSAPTNAVMIVHAPAASFASNMNANDSVIAIALHHTFAMTIANVSVALNAAVMISAVRARYA